MIGYYTPKFLWILRDFVLDVQDKFGKKINSKDYLDNALNDEVMDLYRKEYTIKNY